jgi:hypothetical protein
VGVDPIESILLGSKFPEIVHGPVGPHYLHTPNAAFLHWRQQRANVLHTGSMIRSAGADKSYEISTTAICVREMTTFARQYQKWRIILVMIGVSMCHLPSIAHLPAQRYARGACGREKDDGNLRHSASSPEVRRFNYVCNACRLNCKAVVSDERAQRLLDEMPQIFCPSDDRKPEFKLDKTRALTA